MATLTAREMLDLITANEVDEIASARTLTIKAEGHISQQECEAVVRRIRAKADAQRLRVNELCDLEHREAQRQRGRRGGARVAPP